MPTAKKGLVPSEQGSAPTPHDRLFEQVSGAKNLYDALLKFVSQARLRREGSGEIRSVVQNMAELAIREIDQQIDQPESVEKQGG